MILLLILNVVIPVSTWTVLRSKSSQSVSPAPLAPSPGSGSSLRAAVSTVDGGGTTWSVDGVWDESLSSGRSSDCRGVSDRVGAAGVWNNTTTTTHVIHIVFLQDFKCKHVICFSSMEGLRWILIIDRVSRSIHQPESGRHDDRTVSPWAPLAHQLPL